ncbi:MAG: hypothetical protein E7Z87_01175 [Cyanobacteria bacterium SIG26]|nr:hypothetical protein [Cyanobacteria bacterium SIG26]
MLNSIKEVQRHYTYAVQPVQLFETGQTKHIKKSSSDFLMKDQMNLYGYNLLHPNVSNSSSGSKLDFLG